MMKRLNRILMIIFVLSLVSCNPVQLRRDDDSSVDPSRDGLSTQVDGNLFTQTSSNIDDGAGFSHCSNANVASATYLGSLQLCQNQYSADMFRLRINKADDGDRGCVIPTFVNSTGSSIPLRTQASCFSHQPNEVKTAQLATNNPDCPGCTANSAMVLKESIVPAYYNCMNAVKTYMLAPQNCCSHVLGQPLASGCGGVGVSANICQNNASAYMNGLCGQFKTNYKNKFYLIYNL